jgi:hypothetical protein
MRTFTSFALVAALGLGLATLSKPADAGVVVVAPLPVVYPGYYRYPHAYPGWRHGYGYGYGYGWHRGGWYHGRYWR